METKKEPQTNFLKVSNFQSIKTKILIFALLATILPSLILGWSSYLQSSKLLHDKLSHELRNATVQASGKLDLWLKERLYDLRVFSSSYLISENLIGLDGKNRSRIEILAARAHIKAYLKSVGDKFSIYEELILIDLTGKPVVSSSTDSNAVPLPAPWLNQLQTNTSVKTKPHLELHVGRHSMFIAETIKASNGNPLGILAAIINLNTIRNILENQTRDNIDEIYILGDDGRILVSSALLAFHHPDSPIMGAKPSAAVQDHTTTSTGYVNYQGIPVVGMTEAIPSMGWTMVAEMEKKKAYAEIFVLRRVTLLVVCGLMLSIGILAYIFGHRLVRPVKQLSEGATGVASGNLEVDIPVTGLSEVSYLTQVFNHMVANLRQNRNELSTANTALRKTNEELHQISITDGLTGLFNRKHIMDLFTHEVGRSKRYGHNLTILMLDIDYFKKINDTYGHQVGDSAMSELADSLKSSVRDCDYVGRYGGEEFMAILPDSGIESAIITAERIRQNICRLQLTDGHTHFNITVSIGIAGFPIDGQDAKTILGEADNALYQAKANGRNRIETSERENPPEATKVHLLPNRKSR